MLPTCHFEIKGHQEEGTYRLPDTTTREPYELECPEIESVDQDAILAALLDAAKKMEAFAGKWCAKGKCDCAEGDICQEREFSLTRVDVRVEKRKNRDDDLYSCFVVYVVKSDISCECLTPVEEPAKDKTKANQQAGNGKKGR